MRRRHTGAAVLVMAVILLVAAGFSIVFMTSYSQMQQNIAANQTRANQAFFAAEAGLEYGLAYLQKNGITIVGTAVGGVLNYPLGTTTLANGASYSVTFSNPTVNVLTLLTITAIGRSADGTAIRTMTQNVNLNPSSAYTVTTLGNFTAGGNVTVLGSRGVDAGGAVSTSGSANVSNYIENDAKLSGMTGSDFFSYLFGVSPPTMKAQSTYFANSSSVPWSSLSGIVWVDSNVTLSGNLIVGSVANPVLLIVNGNLNSSGTSTVNGFIYATGTITTSGTTNIIGGMAAQGNINMTGTSITNNEPIMNRYLAGSGYAKVTGSWKDF